MATDEEIEAAARAIVYLHGSQSPDSDILGQDNKPCKLWRWYKDDAKAALEAAEKVRPEPRGCPIPGACACVEE